MIKPLIIGIILLLIVGTITTFIIWGDDIKVKINEWQNRKSNKEIIITMNDKKNSDATSNNTINQPDTTKTTNSNINKKERVNVTNYNIYKLSQENGCDVEFNTDAANEFVTYEGNGISVDLPYNENWGNKNFSVLPYEIGSNEVVFGKLIKLKDCRWAREYILEIIDKRSITKAKDAYYNNGVSQDMIKIYKLSGYTIIRTVNLGNCDQVSYEILGPKYNYVFRAICSSNIKADSEILEKVVNSLTFDNLMLGMN